MLTFQICLLRIYSIHLCSVGVSVADGIRGVRLCLDQGRRWPLLVVDGRLVQRSIHQLLFAIVIVMRKPVLQWTHRHTWVV